jgi:ABC-type branched-subunit amino acid transport system ATPase component
MSDFQPEENMLNTSTVLSRCAARASTLLLAEQNVRRAAAVSSSCYVVEKGRIIKHGAPADVMADEAIRQRLSV